MSLLDFAAFGLQAFAGLPVCADATLVSPISADGVPHQGCVVDPDAVFGPAEDAIVDDMAAHTESYVELPGGAELRYELSVVT